MKRHFPLKTNADFKDLSVAEMILFHLKTGPLGWLSNFAPYPITLDGCEWPTVEHYYQASKFIDDPEWIETIRRNPRPYDARRMG